VRDVLVLLAASYGAAALGTGWLSGFLPWFLVPDVPFLAVIYAALFLPVAAGLAVAVPAAFLRELVSSAPPWSLFLGSMALYFAAREVRKSLFVRPGPFVLVLVAALMAAESAGVALLLVLSGARPFSTFWLAEEVVRIAWTALLSVPAFAELGARLRAAEER